MPGPNRDLYAKIMQERLEGMMISVRGAVIGLHYAIQAFLDVSPPLARAENGGWPRLHITVILVNRTHSAVDHNVIDKR